MGKQYPKERETPPRVPASQQIETKLGKQIVERHREEVKQDLLEDESFRKEAAMKQQIVEFHRELIKWSQI